MKNCDLDERLYKFALSVIKFIKSLPDNYIYREMGRQLLRSATSIVANFSEAKAGFSKDDFTYRLNISLKEARETCIWLKLLKDSGLAAGAELDSILNEATEIRNILGTSCKTAKKKPGVKCHGE